MLEIGRYADFIREQMPASYFEKIICGFFAFLFFAYVAILFVSPARPAGFTWGASTIILPAVELALMATMALTIWKFRATRLKYLVLLTGILIPILAGAVYAIQLISIVISGKYVTVLAMENMGEVRYVTNPATIALSVGMVAVLLVIVFAAIHEIGKDLSPRASGKTILLGASLIALMGVTLSERKRITYHAQAFGIPIELNTSFAPAFALYETYLRFSQARINTNIMALFVDGVGSGTITSPFDVDLSADFPFQQTRQSFGPLPFAIEQSDEPLNVVVLFLEGLSARALGHYGGPYTDLTPNLNSFAEQTITIENFFNHTAATYRGLQGSLASGFPLAGGAGGWESSAERAGELGSISYSTLPDIFNARAYETKIFSPHSKAGPFGDFLRALGFSNVVALEDVTHENPTDELSDQDLFTAMANTLILREKSGNKTPFFWASYNIGSHAFRDTPEGALQYGDGRNSALNRFHELDASVSVFLEAFKASSFADNTILVITTDHSSYAEPPVFEAFSGSPKFTTHFVDQIPLLIRLPGATQAMRFENGIRTSLDLAPTILHMLGIADVDHAFLGTSVFNDQSTPDVNWAVIGHDFYEIDATGVSKLSLESASVDQQVVFGAVMYYFNLELEDRVFNPQ